MKLRAFRKSDGTEVRPGDTVTDFRGETGTFQCATRAPDGGRTGKVTVSGREFYQTVWGLEVRAYPDDETDKLRLAAEAMAAKFTEAGITAEAGLGGSVVICASDQEAAAILAYLGDILANVARQNEAEKQDAEPPAPGDAALSPWAVESELGQRIWHAADVDHALEQHRDAFPDERVTGAWVTDESPGSDHPCSDVIPSGS